MKNGSLAGDFKAGQLPAGAQGIQGTQGLKGDKGDKGDRGPSDAFKETNPFGALTNLPAGNYSISEKVEFSGGTGLASLRCDLVAQPSTGGPSTTLDHSQASATTARGTTDLAIPLQALATFSQAQNLITNCVGSAPGGTPTLNNIHLSAV